MSSYSIEFSKPALKQLSKLPQKMRQKVADEIGSLADDPRPADCKKLSGEDDLYRIRTGDYRVIYRIQDDVLLVLVIRIGHRKEVYR